MDRDTYSEINSDKTIFSERAPEVEMLRIVESFNKVDNDNTNLTNSSDITEVPLKQQIETLHRNFLQQYNSLDLNEGVLKYNDSQVLFKCSGIAHMYEMHKSSKNDSEWIGNKICGESSNCCKY